MNAVELTIYGLATFRLAVMLSEDTGPAHVFQHLRRWLRLEAKLHPALRKSDIHHGIECLRCSSVWVALPVAGFAAIHDRLVSGFAIAGDIFLSGVALSALAILFNRAFPSKK